MAEYNKTALLEEFLHARKSSILLYKSFREEWISKRKGKNEDGESISLISIGYIIIGHWLHHKKVLEQRYGVQFSS